ncbi:MAG: IS30 family transposase [Selenomonadaceae bacterium]|nr:IS30 family transposase [Selenomonadaceae bacterium]
MSYKHLSITERELIAIYRAKNWSICKIAALLERNKSTISRELARNGDNYLPSKTQARYKRRRKKSRPHKLLEKPELFIYRAIYAGMFDTPEQKRSTGNRGAIRHLRHRGKPRRPKGYVSNRGKMPISHELSERPVEALEGIRFGDFEADTVLGKFGQAALLTLVDRKSRFLICRKLARLGSKEVKMAMIEALRDQAVHTITPDRGREFRRHGNVTKELGVEFYFPKARQPWQRGTNENTNGLLREYFPKGFDFNEVSEEQLQAVVEKLNKRPRKCLGYRTPWEIWFSTPLHFV